MQLRAARVFCLCVLELCMHNWFKCSGEEELIQSCLLGLLILDVADTTIGEHVSLYLEFTKDLLDLRRD